MKINRQAVTRTFTIIITSFILLFVFPYAIISAASNYGEGVYGTGSYIGKDVALATYYGAGSYSNGNYNIGNIIAATNYGDGSYGAGNYNEGDTTPPTGETITYTDGYYTTLLVSLAVNDGTDLASGINTASRIIQRSSATLSNNVCGSYSSFVTITPTGTYPNFTDSTVTTGNCYQYQYLISDNPGNQATYTSSSTVKVDTTSPTITLFSTTLRSNGVIIVWTTNENASSQVEYGLTNTYGSTTSETDTSARVINHSISISNLTACSKYNYRVISKDYALNTSKSSNNTFTTLGCKYSGILTNTSSQTEDQSTVTIKVTDSNGNPVEGAKVELYGGSQTAYTNSEGIATFDNVVGTDHAVVISYANSTITKDLNLLVVSKDQNNNYSFVFELNGYTPVLQQSSLSSISSSNANASSKSTIVTTNNIESSLNPIVFVLIGLILLIVLIVFFASRQKKNTQAF